MPGREKKEKGESMSICGAWCDIEYTRQACCHSQSKGIVTAREASEKRCFSFFICRFWYREIPEESGWFLGASWLFRARWNSIQFPVRAHAQSTQRNKKKICRLLFRNPLEIFGQLCELYYSERNFFNFKTVLLLLIYVYFFANMYLVHDARVSWENKTR